MMDHRPALFSAHEFEMPSTDPQRQFIVAGHADDKIATLAGRCVGLTPLATDGDCSLPGIGSIGVGRAGDMQCQTPGARFILEFSEHRRTRPWTTTVGSDPCQVLSTRLNQAPDQAPVFAATGGSGISAVICMASAIMSP